MSATVILGVRLIPTQFQRIKIENINLEDKVEILKNAAAKKINVHKQTIGWSCNYSVFSRIAELIYCGNILNDDVSLASCGIKPGVMIHVLEKKVSFIPMRTRSTSEADIQKLVVAFKTFRFSSNYNIALQKLSRPEVLENIVAATPGLAQDHVAISIIRDPELIIQMSDPDVVRRIADQHPTLIEAAHHIAAHVHEEAKNVNQTQATTSSGYSYSLDALSDDEEMDSSSSDTPREGLPLARNSSYNAITAAQLAAAIANATTATTFGLPGPAPTATTTPGTSVNNPAAANSIITSEMFNSAIQQAFASSPTVGGANSSNAPAIAAPTTPIANEIESFEALSRRLQPQLQQMREMGLIKEAVNLRALQTTCGDVQAAIELVLSGAFE